MFKQISIAAILLIILTLASLLAAQDIFAEEDDLPLSPIPGTSLWFSSRQEEPYWLETKRTHVVECGLRQEESCAHEIKIEEALDITHETATAIGGEFGVARGLSAALELKQSTAFRQAFGITVSIADTWEKKILPIQCCRTSVVGQEQRIKHIFSVHNKKRFQPDSHTEFSWSEPVAFRWKVKMEYLVECNPGMAACSAVKDASGKEIRVRFQCMDAEYIVPLLWDEHGNVVNPRKLLPEEGKNCPNR